MTCPASPLLPPQRPCCTTASSVLLASFFARSDDGREFGVASCAVRDIMANGKHRSELCKLNIMQPRSYANFIPCFASHRSEAEEKCRLSAWGKSGAEISMSIDHWSNLGTFTLCIHHTITFKASSSIEAP